MSGPKGTNPLALDSASKVAYQVAYESAKQVYLMVGQIRRDTSTIDDALAQLDDARAKLEHFKAEFEAIA